jgi:hypothetical protein
MCAAADKDPGNSSSKSISDFAILQVPPIDHLLSVAKDSCVVFPSASGSPLEAISLIRAKELAQAEFALARHKIEEAALKKTSSTSLASSVPEGSSIEGVNPAPAPKRRRGVKVARPQGKRPLTHQKHGLTEWVPNAVPLLEYQGVRPSGEPHPP